MRTSTVDVSPFHTCAVHTEHLTFAPIDISGLPWDPNAELSLNQSVSVDVEGLRRCTRLPESARLAVVMEVVCDQTYWTARHVTDLPASGVDEVRPSVRVPAQTVAGWLSAETSIVLLGGSLGTGQRVAERAGSRLARSGQTRIVLEDGADQFPTAVVPFAATGRVATARWTVEYSYDSPDQPVLGCVRLMLNSDSTDVKRLIDRERAEGQDSRGIGAELRRFVLADVVRHAVSDVAFDDADVWPEESLGRLVADVLDRYLEGRSLGQLRALEASDRPRFEQLLQSVVPESLHE